MKATLKILYKYELKKLLFSRVNLVALAGSAIMLLVLAFSSVSGEQVSLEAAEALEGREIDARLIEEMKPALRYENGSTVLEAGGEGEKYGPILDVIASIAGSDSDLTRFHGAELYDLREQGLNQRMDGQGLTEAEKAFWRERESGVRKPFVYRRHSGPANLLRSFQAFGFFALLLSAVGLSGVYARETADNMNQLLLCSRYGRQKLYAVKFAAGVTWMLLAASIVVLSALIPFCAVVGMSGMGEALQLVKPWSMLPCTIGRMLAIHLGIYLLSAVLYAAVTMLLSVITQNAIAVTCGLLGYLLVDLFAAFPDRFPLLQKLWSLRPNAVLMNAGYSNYRLIHLAGRLLLNYQAAPAIYAVIIVAAIWIGRRTYRKLQVGK